MTTRDLAIALAKQCEEEGITFEELTQILSEAEEEARQEIEEIRRKNDRDK